MICVPYSRKSTIQRIGNTSYLCEKRLLTDYCKENGLSYAWWCSQALAMYIMLMYASARFRERWIVSIDVPCVWHLCVHVWVRNKTITPLFLHEIVWNFDVLLTNVLSTTFILLFFKLTISCEKVEICERALNFLTISTRTLSIFQVFVWYSPQEKLLI